MRPTYASMRLMRVVLCRGGNFQASAQRGLLARLPRRRCAVVDLEHAAVDLVGERLALGLQGAVPADGVLGRLAALAMRVHAQPERLHELERLPLRARPPARRRRNLPEVDLERARRRDLRVELAQAAGRRVARIRERALATPLAGLVQRGEVVLVHVDLAARDEPARDRTSVAAAQPHRHGPDRAHVLGHVLARLPVAARRGALVAPVAPGDLDAEPVELRLGHDREPLLAELGAAVVPEAPERGLVGHGLKALHRRLVAQRAERSLRLGADALCRAVRRDEIGPARLDPLELALELVVLGVGDDGVVLRVVAEVVVVDLLAQRRGALARLRPGPLLGFAAHQSPSSARKSSRRRVFATSPASSQPRRATSTP